MKIYILDQRKDNTKHNATGKAMTDVFEIMGKCNVKTVPGVPKDANKYLKIFDLFILGFYSVFVFGKNDYCIFVYQDNAVKIKMLKKLKGIRKFKTICFVNDVNSIRSDGLYSTARKADIDRDFGLIGTADIIMAPNKGSKAYIEERGMKNTVVTVDVWDYLMDEQMAEKCFSAVDYVKPIAYSVIDKLSGENVNNAGVRNPKWKIGFAGNLGKSAFLDELSEVYDENVEYHLWGDTEGKEFKNNNVIYEGSVSPNVLPLELSEKCNFGLVWDGIKAKGIEGGYGEYLRFNNSHKCGCYLASGLPVFVWSGSGMSHFVKENACGFLIEGLDDIPAILSSLSRDDYDSVLKAAREVAVKIHEGYYLETALKEAVGGTL